MPIIKYRTTAWFIAFLTCICAFSETKAQNSKPAPAPLGEYERYIKRADDAARIGEYNRAIRLYELCLSLPLVNEDTDIKRKLRRVNELENLHIQAMIDFRAKRYEKAILLTEEIVKQNPTDRRAQQNLKDFRILANSKPNPETERFLARAEELRKKGQTEQSAAIYRMILTLPASTINESEKRIARDRIKEIGEIETGTSKEQQVQNKKAYEELRKDAEHNFKRGFYANARNLLLKIRKLEGYANDRYMTGRLELTGILIRKKREITDWQADPSRKREISINYEYVLRRNPTDAITRNEYCAFARSNAEAAESAANSVTDDNIRKNSLSKALGYYQGVQVICQSDKASIDNKITSIKSRLERIDNRLLVETLKSAADLNAANRRYPEALRLYEEAGNKASACNCVPEVQKNSIAEKIETLRRRINSCQTYFNLIQLADEASSNDDCQKAIDFYRRSDSLVCEEANKPAVLKKIAEMENCLRRQCFDSLYTKAEKSRRDRFYRDALRYYRQSLNCPAPSTMRPLIDSVIIALECITGAHQCDSVITLKNINTLTKIDVVASIKYSIPSVFIDNSQVEGESNVAFSAGIRLNYLQFKGFIDFRTGVLYDYQVINILNNLSASKALSRSIKLSSLQIPLMMKLHPPKKSVGQIKPYLILGASFLLPIQAKHTNYSNGTKLTSTDEKIVRSILPRYRFGIGLESQGLKKGLSLEAFFEQMPNMFNPNLVNSILGLYPSRSSAEFKQIGIELGIRLW